MSIDYDAPRAGEDQELPARIAELRPRVRPGRALTHDDLDGPVNLPDVELDGLELSVEVLPRQADEFVCGGCFLIHHGSLMGPGTVCVDCA